MNEQSATKRLIDDINRLMVSEEYAQLQELALQYKATMAVMDEAFKPHAEVIRQALLTYQANMAEIAKAIQPCQAQLQQLAIEISKGLALLIEELKKHHEVDTEPLDELQKVMEGKEPLDAIGQFNALSCKELSRMIEFVIAAMGIASDEQKPVLWALFVVLFFTRFFKQAESAEQKN